MFSPVAIGVAAGLGTLIATFFFIRFYLWIKRRAPSNPLPPVQMLAHDRLRQQEMYHSQSNYADHLQALSPIADAPGSYEYESSSSDVRTLEVASNFEETRAASRSSPLAELNNPETEQHQPLSRATSSSHLSAKSSFSSSPSSQAPPHKRLDHFETVLPSPLATEQDALHAIGKRVSVYDQWSSPLGEPVSKLGISIDSDSSQTAGSLRVSQGKTPVPSLSETPNLSTELRPSH